MEQKVRKGEELNLVNLQSYLLSSGLIESKSPIQVTQFTNGFSNLTYLLQIDNQEFVLRRPPFGAVKRGHDMSREFKVLTGLNKGFAKAPKAFVYTDDPEIIGSSFYIMEKVEGIILSAKEAKKRNISEEDFPVIAASWLDTFVDLHALDYKSLGLEDLGKPNGYVERQVSNWGKQYLKAKTDDIPEAEKVMAWMQENQPKKYEFALIHNDYKYDNVVFEDDSWKNLTAILDWEMCTLGDPLMDLGTSTAYWTMLNDSPLIHAVFPSPTAMPGNPGREELVEMYAQKSGREIKHMVFYFAFGLFKIAVIVQQIYFRFTKGLTTDPRFANLNHMTKLLISMAWQAIQKNRIERLFS